MFKNRLVVIGYTGIKRCYFNISREEAIGRYLASEKSYEEDEPYLDESMISEVEFDDEFNAYEVWGL